MVDGEAWYFLRGQETVGPLSRESLLQSHRSGQVLLETLVWSEGMEGWKPAGGIPGLLFEVPRIEPKPFSGAFTTDSKPSMAFTKTAARLSKSKTTPKKKKKKSSGEEDSRKMMAVTFFTSLFMVAMGAIAYFFRDRLPNVTWFVWLSLGLGGCGVLSLLGLRVLDGIFRFASLLLLVPPLMLFWPLIMGDESWRTIPDAEYLFVGYCALYCLTIRIGLRDYVVAGLSTIAALTGSVTLAFSLCVALSIWKPAGWDELLEKGGQVRLPGLLAQAVNHPQWGTHVGTLELPIPNGDLRHAIERATFKRQAQGGYQLTLKTLDGLVFQVPMTGVKTADVIGQDWPISLPTHRIDEMERMEMSLPGDKVLPVVSATLHVDRIQNSTWEGSIKIQVGKDKELVSTMIVGTFKTSVMQQ